MPSGSTCSSARLNAAVACSRRPSVASTRPRTRASLAIGAGPAALGGERLVRRAGRRRPPPPGRARRARRRRGRATARSPARRCRGWGSARRPAPAPPAPPRRRRARSRPARGVMPSGTVRSVASIGSAAAMRAYVSAAAQSPRAAGTAIAAHHTNAECGCSVSDASAIARSADTTASLHSPVAYCRCDEDGQADRAEQQRAHPQLARGRRLEVGAGALDVAAGEPQPAALPAQVQVGALVAGLGLLERAVGLVGAAQPPQAERERRRPADRERVARREAERAPAPHRPRPRRAASAARGRRCDAR